MHDNGPINAVTTASGCKRAMIRSRVSLSQEIVLIGESKSQFFAKLTAGGDSSAPASQGPPVRDAGRQAGRMTG